MDWNWSSAKNARTTAPSMRIPLRRNCAAARRKNRFRAGSVSDGLTVPVANAPGSERKNTMELIRLNDITKTYHLGEIDVPVLRGVSLSVERGEMLALMGVSGSGKSTLMNILGCLDRPSSGQYWLDGEEVSRFSAGQRALVR